MNRRTLLRAQLFRAWRRAIEGDYHRQRINSERSLQASFWSKLNAILPHNSRRMFIEPILKAKVPADDGQGAPEFRYPDIVICNTSEVIGIVEIKYLPRAKPSWKKDLQTFSWINTNRNQISIQNVRHRGVAVDNHEYRLSPAVLFVWAAVHAPLCVDLKEEIEPSIKPYFLPLHAETRHNANPTIR